MTKQSDKVCRAKVLGRCQAKALQVSPNARARLGRLPHELYMCPSAETSADQASGQVGAIRSLSMGGIGGDWLKRSRITGIRCKR